MALGTISKRSACRLVDELLGERRKKTSAGLDRTNSSELYGTSVRNVVGIIRYDLPPVECKRLGNTKNERSESVLRGTT